MPVGGIFTTGLPSPDGVLVDSSPSRRSMLVSMRTFGQQHRALDGVLQLADVAGPVVAHQQLQRVGRQAVDAASSARRRSGAGRTSPARDVVLALAQRRHVDRDDVEAVVEVLAELPVGDHLRQVAVGRRDDADVGAQRAGAAEALELVLLQDAQDLRLRVGAHVADFVEEQRAAVGLLEAADALLVGAGERALLVSEQLGLEQVLLQRRAVDLDEVARRAQRVVVDGAGDQLLAGARFAADEAGRVALARPS